MSSYGVTRPHELTIHVFLQLTFTDSNSNIVCFKGLIDVKSKLAEVMVCHDSDNKTFPEPDAYTRLNEVLFALIVMIWVTYWYKFESLWLISKSLLQHQSDDVVT